jgi:hypothetical protein
MKGWETILVVAILVVLIAVTLTSLLQIWGIETAPVH